MAAMAFHGKKKGGAPAGWAAGGVSVPGQAFPRFYFMSSADLLDVLSNGNNPARVVHHFPKFFNAIEASLK